MKIKKNTVVTLKYFLTDIRGNILEDNEEPMRYLHGDYNGIFRKIEEALEGKKRGYFAQVQLESKDAFGSYNPKLIRIESRLHFQEPLQIGMQFEGISEEDLQEKLIYTVTDFADEKVILDGNHPLAGMIVCFAITVIEVREATLREIEHGHVHEDDKSNIIDHEECQGIFNFLKSSNFH